MFKIEHTGDSIEVEFDGDAEQVIKELVQALSYALHDFGVKVEIEPKQLLQALLRVLSERGEEIMNNIEEPIN